MFNNSSTSKLHRSRLFRAYVVSHFVALNNGRLTLLLVSAKKEKIHGCKQSLSKTSTKNSVSTIHGPHVDIVNYNSRDFSIELYQRRSEAPEEGRE